MSLASRASAATTYTWTGGGANSYWSNGTNWGGSGPSGTLESGSNEILYFGLASNTTAVVDSAWYLQSLTFGANSGNVTLSGNNLTITAATAITANVAGTFANNISNNISLLAATATIYSGNTASGNLNLSGNITGGNMVVIRGRGNNSSISGNIAGTTSTVNVTKTDSGVWTLGGNNNKIASLYMSGGTIKLGAANALGVSNPNLIFGNAYSSGTIFIDLNGYNQKIGGLTVSNDYATNIDRIGNNAASLSTLTYSKSSAETFSGQITGNLTFDKQGAGTLTLSGSNSYSGGTIVEAGVLKIGANNTLAVNTSITLGTKTTSGTLDLGGFNQTVGSVVVAADAAAANQVITNSATGLATISFSGTGSSVFSGCIKDGAGSTGVALTNGTLALSGSHNYTGATTISAGELDVNGVVANSAINVQARGTLGGSGTANGTVTVQDGAVTGSGFQLGAAIFSGQSTISGTTKASSITVAGGTTSASGVTTSNGNLIVSANATLTNSGTTSATTINVNNTGTLNNNGLLSGTVNVSGLFNGTGKVSGALIIKANGELAPGNGSGTTVEGNLTVENGAKVTVQLAAGRYDQMIVTGAGSLVTLNEGSILNLSLDAALSPDQTLLLIDNQSDKQIEGTFSTVLIGGTSYDLSSTHKFSYGGVEYELNYNVDAGTGSSANDLVLAVVVPEPGTWAMLAGGLGMLLGLKRFLRHKA